MNQSRESQNIKGHYICVYKLLPDRSAIMNVGEKNKSSSSIMLHYSIDGIPSLILVGQFETDRVVEEHPL